MDDVVGAIVEDSPRFEYTGNGPYDVKELRPMTYNEKLRESGIEITKLVVEKNQAYGDAINKVHDVIKILFPKGIKPEKYMDMLLLVRDLDKTCRIADGDPAAFDENPWKDKAGYGICGMALNK
jgi:hypothetical protein